MKKDFLKPLSFVAIIAIIISSFFSCSKNNSSGSGSGSDSTDTVPAIYKKIYGATSITTDGTYITIKSKGLPDHKSPYYAGTAWAATLDTAYGGSNASYSKNPNSIGEQDYTFKIPLHPASASTKQATSLGSIGVSLNGVPFYNQYNGQNNPLTVEINSFDQYNGHPDQTDSYHYHVEPLYLTENKGEDAFLGFLLDGFPVYGPMENGVLITNADLDAYHGHTTATADYPNGIYHYHITAADPYINGNGFYGTAGTVSH
ncbi:MAG TPA: YHYH protein [Puia sp.]|jgi:hypothetical protein|nr:YHYH protein [Puia sp.]